MGENYINQLNNGADDTYYLFYNLQNNNRVKEKLTIYYKKDSGISPVSAGELTGKVSKKVGALETFCTNAKSRGLCVNLTHLTPGLFGEADYNITCHNNYPGTCW